MTIRKPLLRGGPGQAVALIGIFWLSLIIAHSADAQTTGIGTAIGVSAYNPAVAVPQTPIQPQVSEPISTGNRKIPNGSFVYSMKTGYWRFLLGPVGETKSYLLLYHDPDPKDGGISFACRSNGDVGDMVVVVPMADTKLTQGQQADISVSVDGETRSMKMTANKDGLLYNIGNSGLAILNKLSGLPEGMTGSIVFAYRGNPIATGEVQQDHSILTDGAGICKKWVVASAVKSAGMPSVSPSSGNSFNH